MASTSLPMTSSGATPITNNNSYIMPEAPRTLAPKPRPMKWKVPPPAEALPTSSSGLVMTSAEKTTPVLKATGVRIVDPRAMLLVDLKMEINGNTKKNDRPPPTGMPEPDKKKKKMYPKPLDKELSEEELQEIFARTLTLERLTMQQKASHFCRTVEVAYQRIRMKTFDAFDEDSETTLGIIKKEITKVAVRHTLTFFPDWIPNPPKNLKSNQEEPKLQKLPKPQDPLQMNSPLKKLQPSPQTSGVPALAQCCCEFSLRQLIKSSSMASSFGTPLLHPSAFYGAPLSYVLKQMYYSQKSASNPFLTGQRSSNNNYNSNYWQQSNLFTQQPLQQLSQAGLESAFRLPESSTPIPPDQKEIITETPRSLEGLLNLEDLTKSDECVITAMTDQPIPKVFVRAYDRLAKKYKKNKKLCDYVMRMTVIDDDVMENEDSVFSEEDFNLVSYLMNDQDEVSVEAIGDVICEAIESDEVAKEN